MGNIREKYRVEVDSKKTKKEQDKKNIERTSYDMASYPFGAEEMLLNIELKNHLKDDDLTK